MLVLGLVLVLIAVGAVLAMVLSGPDTSVSLFDGHLHATALTVFLAGAATLLLVVLGLALMRIGARRARTNRQNNKRLRRLERNEAARRNQGPAPVAATRGEAVADRRPGHLASSGSTDPSGTAEGESGKGRTDPGRTLTGESGNGWTDPSRTSTGESGSTSAEPGSPDGR